VRLPIDISTISAFQGDFPMRHPFGRSWPLPLTLMLSLLISGVAMAQYQVTNLTSNQKGKAKHFDPHLVNGWGLTYAPNGPIFVADTGTGLATSYNAKGVPQKTVVTIPSASGMGLGSPTGIVYNGSKEFLTGGAPAMFLFSTLDGTISGWSPANGNQAIILVNNAGSGASYNGLAITTKKSGNFIYAPDFTNNRVDVYDGKFEFVTSLIDKTVPTGFVPLNVQDVGGKIYVAYANADAGKGNGFIDIFKENGVFIKRFAHGKPLNQPYYFAVAPKNFGPLSHTLLICNNTDSGTINAFNQKTGKFVGTVKDAKGKPIVIDQIWGIDFGGGKAINGKKNQLFFAAGPKA
jgi:uncharacterized protein (TIGR03118 family)